MPRTLRDHTQSTMVLAAASPPDSHGYFSLGTNADYVAPLIGHVPFFLEVMESMPRTSGQNQIHHSQVEGWIESDRAPLEVPPIAPSERDERIADFVAAEIPDGATIQVGIGGVPNALLSKLSGHKDLGVHTELISDGIMDLVEQGVITGTRKQMWVDKIVSTFALGTRQLYDWLDDNIAIQLMPVDLVNDPRRIAREHDFMSINATTEVDLYGQCASETVAGKYWSSSGGQADFARGALYAERGKAFIVLHSTTSSGKSRISATLSPGSVVTTLKNTVDHVVTEYGIARLRGRSFAERARALIAIAHPDHRQELERTAFESGILSRRSH
jgi:acyl-CoA hydrolase